MSNTCSNCYTGCVEIISDKCVKYTGLDIEILGIKKGDSINYVSSVVANWLVTLLDGSGIKFELETANVCAAVSAELAQCDDVTIVDIVNALSKVICDIEGSIATISSGVDDINATYSLPCSISGLTTGDEGTNAVVQAALNYMCNLNTTIQAIATDLATNYVLIADINTYIQDYLDSLNTPTTLYKDKMVPNTVVEYYGSLSNFDASGAGTGDWIEIYLCNGNNGTPDKRGRIAVGAHTMGGGALANEVDYNISGIPFWDIGSLHGTYTHTLTQNQIPSHTHIATSGESGGHSHTYDRYVIEGTESGSGGWPVGYITTSNTSSVPNHTHNITVQATGGGASHPNYQPGRGCYYIMYIPSP